MVWRLVTGLHPMASQFTRKEVNNMDYAKESLRLHEQWKGKIEVVATVPVETKEDLSLAYTPGVAQPCLEIQKDV